MIATATIATATIAPAATIATGHPIDTPPDDGAEPGLAVDSSGSFGRVVVGGDVVVTGAASLMRRV